MAATSQPTKPTGYTDKQTIRVLTVDKDRRRIECATRDGAIVYAAVWESPMVFRWPKTGEIWTIRKDSGIWRLDSHVRNQQVEESGSVPLESLQEGETRVLGDRIFFEGSIVLPIGTEPKDDEIPKGSAVLWFDGEETIGVKAKTSNGTLMLGSITLTEA